MKKPFLILEAIIYVLFLILDIYRINTTYIKYLGIILCFLYAVYNRKKIKAFAMFFTLLADLFLLVLLDHYEIGILSFIVVQLSYLYFLGNSNKAYFNMFLYIRGLIIILGTILLVMFNSLSILNVFVLVYFTNLVFNCIEAWIIGDKLFALGLTLFIGCDICVGLFNINTTNHVALYLSWFFYLPSQVLIVLS